MKKLLGRLKLHKKLIFDLSSFSSVLNPTIQMSFQQAALNQISPVLEILFQALFRLNEINI